MNLEIERKEEKILISLSYTYIKKGIYECKITNTFKYSPILIKHQVLGSCSETGKPRDSEGPRGWQLVKKGENSSPTLY